MRSTDARAAAAPAPAPPSPLDQHGVKDAGGEIAADGARVPVVAAGDRPDARPRARGGSADQITMKSRWLEWLPK